MVDDIIKLVKECRDIILDKKRKSEFRMKGLGDYVTQVDFDVQSFLKEKLLKAYPEIQFMAEEGEQEKIDFTKKVWILDPIDGTANLVHGLNQSAVSLGLIENNVPVLGVVYNPFYNELFYAEKGKGAYLNGEKIHVSTAEKMINCLISAGTAPYYKEISKENFEVIRSVYEHSEDIRRFGTAAIDLCNLAAGRIDGFFERLLKPWDYAAGAAILAEAGGKITGYNMENLTFFGPSDIIASNTLIHDELADVVNGRV